MFVPSLPKGHSPSGRRSGRGQVPWLYPQPEPLFLPYTKGEFTVRPLVFVCRALWVLGSCRAPRRPPKWLCHELPTCLWPGLRGMPHSTMRHGSGAVAHGHSAMNGLGAWWRARLERTAEKQKPTHRSPGGGWLDKRGDVGGVTQISTSPRVLPSRMAAGPAEGQRWTSVCPQGRPDGSSHMSTPAPRSVMKGAESSISVAVAGSIRCAASSSRKPMDAGSCTGGKVVCMSCPLVQFPP